MGIFFYQSLNLFEAGQKMRGSFVLVSMLDQVIEYLYAKHVLTKLGSISLFIADRFLLKHSFGENKL